MTSSPAFGRNLTTSVVLPSRLLPVASRSIALDCDYNHHHICLFHITGIAWHGRLNLKESVCCRFAADAAGGNNQLNVMLYSAPSGFRGLATVKSGLYWR
jgi:hypothetical protein